MSLKQSNKNRKKVEQVPILEEPVEDLSWTPLYGLAKKETEEDVLEVQNIWKLIPKIHKEI